MVNRSPDKDQLYQMAVEAAKNNQKQPARMMFQQILQQDKQDTRAMLWLAKIAATPQERAKWLRRVLKLDPKNKTARKALSKLENLDNARRNKLLLRVGVAAYVLIVFFLSILMIIINT